MKSSIMGMQASVKWDPMQALFAKFRFSQLLNGTKNNDLAFELSLNLNFAEPLGKQFAYKPNQNSNMLEAMKKQRLTEMLILISHLLCLVLAVVLVLAVAPVVLVAALVVLAVVVLLLAPAVVQVVF